ncbi:MAG: hypothetical protein U5L01_03245 [Rheinheimera sp.]|nr:hypothetical protein [Rheinheimera sp.]
MNTSKQCQANLPAHVQLAVDFTIGLNTGAQASGLLDGACEITSSLRGTHPKSQSSVKV